MHTPVLDKIKEIVQRYVLRIDVEKEYVQIIEIPLSLRGATHLFDLDSDIYIDQVIEQGIEYEVNYLNLRKVVLNPRRFLVVDATGKAAIFDNSDLKKRIQGELSDKHLAHFSFGAKHLLRLLEYRYVFSDKILDQIRGSIKRRFLYAVNELKTKEKPGYKGELHFLHEKELYQCCNQLGARHFDDLILKLFRLYDNHYSDYFRLMFLGALVHFESSKPANFVLFKKTYDKARADYYRSKGTASLPNQNKKIDARYIAAVVIFGMLFLGYFLFLQLEFDSENKSNQETNSGLFPMPELTFFQAFRFDQKQVFENQYDSANYANFSPCELTIENTQFENYETDSERFKKITLVNKSQKDVIVIWANDQALSYSFLSANGSYAIMRPVNGMLKLYAGEEPQSTIENLSNEEPNFRFGVFTMQDSLLLREEFDLREIGPDNSQFSLFDENGTVGIKAGF